MKTPLTPELLLSYGFVELKEKDILDRPIYRLSKIESNYGFYPFDIQVVLSPEYGESNPNSGTVSIYSPTFSFTTIPDDLLDKEDWTTEDQKRVDENVEVAEAILQPIAWHVTTFERLKTIIEPLTLTTLEYGK